MQCVKQEKRKRAGDYLCEMLELFTSDLIEALYQIGYFSNELLTADELSEVRRRAREESDLIIKQIYGKQSGKVQEHVVRGAILTNHWILKPGSAFL